jgi:PAS domain S-box-containing protein
MAGEHQAGYYVLMPAEKNAPPEQTSTDRFRLLVDAVQDYGIFMLDTEGKVASWNTGAERMKQYRPDEIIGRNFSVFYPPEAIAAKWPAEELRRAEMNGRFEEEGWRIRKDGSRFWANVVITALRNPDGTLAGFGKVTRDLTERRAHEEALRESEQHFRLMIEGVRDYAIFMLSPDGVIESWNSGAQLIKGYSPSEVIGKHFSLFYRPEDLEAGKARNRAENSFTAWPGGGRRLARAPRRLGVLGQRGDLAGLRRQPAAARFCQSHTRHDGTAAPV